MQLDQQILYKHDMIYIHQIKNLNIKLNESKLKESNWKEEVGDDQDLRKKRDVRKLIEIEKEIRDQEIYRFIYK